MRKLILVAILGSLTFTVSCVKNKCPEVKIVQSSGEDPVYAVINGENITQATLDKELSNRDKGAIAKAEAELFEAKMEVLEEFVFNKLIQAEAKKKNLSTEEFMKKEVDAKIKQPSNKDVESFYKNVKGQYEKNGKTPPPLNDTVKDQIKQQLMMKATIERRQALNNQMLARNSVTYGLEQPRVKVDVGSLPAKGAKEGAPVTIVEFSDFQCPYCKKGADTMKKVMSKYGSKVRYFFRDYPLSFHDRAKAAANAARCATEQGKFWQYHDKLFDNQSKLSDEDLIAHGKSLGLDMAKFEPCVKEMKLAANVDADMRAGEEAGVSGTPAYFVNGIFLSGALPIEKFEKVIDAELKK